MWRRIKIDSWAFATVVPLALFGLTLLASYADPDGPHWFWLILRVLLLGAGIGGAVAAVGLAGIWLQYRQLRNESLRDRSWDPATVPTGLIEMREDLQRLGFVATGQMEMMSSADSRRRTYEVFGRPLDPRIVAQLSYARVGGSFVSYFRDGRSLETVFPPIDVSPKRGWKVLPDWLEAQQCGDGVPAALALHEARLERPEEAGLIVPVPDYATALMMENAGTLRLREFHERQVMDQIRKQGWNLVSTPVLLWVAIFWRWP